jgi:hypothetical protein
VITTRKLSILILMLFCSPVSAVTPEPAPVQETAIVLIGATAHIGDGSVINNALLMFSKGKITHIGSAAEGPPGGPDGHHLIDVSGQHIYPGLIAVASRLGLIEVNSLRASSDQQERGALNPNVRALVAYNTDSELIPTLRHNGVLMAQVAPAGGLVSGQSSVVQLDAWNWEDAAYVHDDALYINWPRQQTTRTIPGTSMTEYTDNETYRESVAALTRLFESAQMYNDDETPQPNIKLRSMSRLFTGEQRLFIRVEAPMDIVASIQFARKFGVQHVVITGGSGALPVTEFLLEEKVPVLLNSLYRLPSYPHFNVNSQYRLPFRLIKAGVTVGLTDASNITGRNLPFIAGTAAAHGVDREMALRLVTLNNATILGIDDTVGSLAVGKDATLFVSSGDALDIRTNNLTAAFIQGRTIELSGMQQQLHERFKRKYSSE